MTDAPYSVQVTIRIKIGSYGRLLGSGLNWPPDDCCDDAERCKEGFGELVIACGDTTEVLQAAKGSLHNIAMPVFACIKSGRLFVAFARRNDGFCSTLAQPGTQRLAVIPLVGDDFPHTQERIQALLRETKIACLTGT